MFPFRVRQLPYSSTLFVFAIESETKFGANSHITQRDLDDVCGEPALSIYICGELIVVYFAFEIIIFFLVWKRMRYIWFGCVTIVFRWGMRRSFDLIFPYIYSFYIIKKDSICCHYYSRCSNLRADNRHLNVSTGNIDVLLTKLFNTFTQC